MFHWWLSWCASLIAQLVKNLPQCRRPWLDSWVGKILWRRDRLPTPVFLGFPCGSAGKESTSVEGDLGSIPGLGRFLGVGKGYPLQYSGLENSMDCVVHRVAKRQTRLRTFIFTFNAEDARDASSMPRSGRSLGEGNGNLLQSSCLGNPMDREAW